MKQLLFTGLLLVLGAALVLFAGCCKITGNCDPDVEMVYSEGLYNINLDGVEFLYDANQNTLTVTNKESGRVYVRLKPCCGDDCGCDAHEYRFRLDRYSSRRVIHVDIFPGDWFRVQLRRGNEQNWSSTIVSRP